MNDHLLAQELAAVLAGPGYAALAALVPQIHPVQAAEVTHRPTIGVTGEYQPYLQRRKGTVTFELRSRIGDETLAGEHQQRFVVLWNALLGAAGGTTEATRANRANAKAALKAAILTRGAVEIADYGPAANAVVADAEGDDLRTAITLQIVWTFRPL